MNHYAKGGEAHGIKSLAKELGKYGRNGDTMVAHINPQEAALLKSLGGSGTINPVTGLPEFWGFSIGPIGIGSDYGGISVGRTSIGDVLDKSGIGDLIGSLGPIAPMAAAYFGGPLAAGIVGGIGKDGKINLQRGLMTGIMAYGAQNLAKGLGDVGAAGSSSTASTGAPSISVDDLGVPLLPADAAATAAAGPTPVGSIVYDDAGQLLTSADRAAMAPKAGIGQAFSEFGDKAANVARGAYRLSTGAPGASEAFKASGATMMNTAAPMYMGSTGVMAIDEAEKMKAVSDDARARAAAEEAAILGRIENSRQRGIAAMQRNPYQFAMGGPVPQMAPGGLAALQGERDGYEIPQTSYGNIPQFAAGGMPPRFLSGGGDGMSDDIPATINNKQPARLADGEFVIPADVVSHLGNGSSKAGAKQLYSMMDKVRQARTGTKKQGKQINPNKFMPV